MAKAHTDAAIPDSPLVISLLGAIDGCLAAVRHTSLGLGFGTSFATADNTGVSSVTPKIPRTKNRFEKKINSMLSESQRLL